MDVNSNIRGATFSLVFSKVTVIKESGFLCKISFLHDTIFIRRYLFCLQNRLESGNVEYCWGPGRKQTLVEGEW